MFSSLHILFKLRESVRKFADEQLAPIAAEIDAKNEIPQMKEVWKKLGDMGLLGITAPGVCVWGGGREGEEEGRETWRTTVLGVTVCRRDKKSMKRLWIDKAFAALLPTSGLCKPKY